MNRRDCIIKLSGLGIWSIAPDLFTLSDAVLKRTIPSTGEQLPTIGLGTWRTFDVANSASATEPLKKSNTESPG